MHEFVMRAHVQEASLFQDQNDIRPAQQAQAIRHHKSRAAPHGLAQG
jgi:hypothetical protein